MSRLPAFAWALLAVLALSGCGADAGHYSLSQLGERTECEGGTYFVAPSQSDRYADRTRACDSPFGSVRINLFTSNAKRDMYVHGNVVNPITGTKDDDDFFVFGDRWAISCQSAACQRGIAEATGGAKAP